MDDKRLDELLSDLKKNYDTLPEYTKTEDIMNELPKKKPKKPRFRGLPLVAIVAGIFLLSILALPQIGEYQQADESVDEEGVEETDEQINEFTEYANKKEEEFRKELGVDSLEKFTEIEFKEHLLADIGSGIYSDEDIIASIDDIFITPQQIIKELDQTEGEERYFQWLRLIQKFTFLGLSFSQHVEAVLGQSSLGAEAQDELVENQFNYSGSIEIVELLQLIHKHGYYIERVGNQTKVTHDFGYLVDEVEYHPDDEGIRRFFTFIAKETNLQSFDFAYSSIDVPWYEADDILLELENIYRSYPEYREIYTHYTNAIHGASEYLKYYIHGGFSSPDNLASEELIEELRYFTEKHQDSTFWPLVSEALRKYESGDTRLEDSMERYNTGFLFNNIESQLSYDRLYNFYSWPILSTTELHYINHVNLEKDGVLTNLSPLELLSLYTYAASENRELYDALYIGVEERNEMSWASLVNESPVIIEKAIDEDTIEFSFVNTFYEPFENTIVVTVKLQRDGESWKVISQEKKDIK